MNTKLILIGIFAVMSGFAHAERGKTDILRGGTGFLFADANAFTNAGQSALNKGVALGASYAMTEVLGQSITAAGPSLVYGNGSFGLGGFVTRAGTSLTEDGTFTTTGGGQLGLALAKGKVTLGAGYQSELETPTGTTTSESVMSGSINYNGGSKGKGIVLGAGIEAHSGGVLDYNSTTFALGYSFRRGAGIEVNVSMDEFDMDTMVIGGHFLWSNKNVYLGAGYDYVKLTQAGTFSGRFGLVFGAIDLSAFVSMPSDSSLDPTYGGGFRLTF